MIINPQTIQEHNFYLSITNELFYAIVEPNVQARKPLCFLLNLSKQKQVGDESLRLVDAYEMLHALSAIPVKPTLTFSTQLSATDKVISNDKPFVKNDVSFINHLYQQENGDIVFFAQHTYKNGFALNITQNTIENARANLFDTMRLKQTATLKSVGFEINQIN